jgi:hypothetical protein
VPLISSARQKAKPDDKAKINAKTARIDVNFLIEPPSTLRIYGFSIILTHIST